MTITEIEGQVLDPEQKNYLEGFLAGVRQRAALGTPAAVTEPEEPEIIQTAEERIKSEEHPLDSYYRLVENAAANRAPDKEDTFRFKWNGLFFLNPVEDAFMARLRIPGGVLKSFQLREIARVAKERTSGAVQITTRANLQIRLIKPKDAPEVLRRIQSIGLHTRGAGGDNIRNLTTNPTAGIDPHEVIDCLPLVQELADFILGHREFYNLPRKFNIALDGGGLIGAVEDTNDIGAKAVRKPDGRVVFRIALGGATGHQAFARDMGVEVAPEDLVRTIIALVRVFIAHGNRGDRKKARLKHLLDRWTLEHYREETEKLLGGRLPLAELPVLEYPSQELPHSHVGVFPQKQVGRFYVGLNIPVGQITPAQLQRVADLAENYGSGEVRLTVWQNLILPNIPEAYLGTVRKAVERLGFATSQNPATSGVIACTGNRFCKYAATDTKGHAQQVIAHLAKHVPLDEPVNIHLTGCPHSCAQHYMGDIGLLGAKTRDGREAYHVLVGGGFGKNAACGRQVYQAMPFEEIPVALEKMLKAFLHHRTPGESFQTFTARHELNALQVLFQSP
jgi:ferredoxin-nitrite reductase